MMGMTANGCSTALPEEPFAFAAEPKRGCELNFAFAEEPGRGCELKALGTSAGGGNTCPDIRAWVEGEKEDAPNFGTLPQFGRSF